MQQNLVGQKLGRYTIREMLGMGGMGAVYRAYQEDLKREVALKVIAANYSGQEELVARFIREAQTAAGLEHAHIVPIYDYGVISSQLYIVMRMLTGGTLSDRIEAARRSGKLPSPNECAKLLDQLAGALDYAHERGVIHRDIKPGNIMFDNHGDAFLVDFGIAKAGDSTNLTRGSSVIGSPSYMAPEQWRGEAAGPNTDQYALGVVLYTMLTGKLPFEADTPYAVMQLHVNTPPPSPNTHRADLSPSVGMVLERALSKNAADRYPTMRAFAVAFRLAVGDTRPGTETGFFTRTIERTMKTAIIPGGSGSQSGIKSPNVSQNVSQTLKQQRVGLAVGLGVGLVIAVIVGVILLMQSAANNDVFATQNAIEATLVGMSAGTETAQAIPTSTPEPPTEAAPTEPGEGETSEPATSVSLLPTTATEAFTPSPTLSPTPSATATATLNPQDAAATSTSVQVQALAAASTENAAVTGTARADARATATESVRLAERALTAEANTTETQIAEGLATQAAIGTNAASTFQAEDRATQQAVDSAATLDAIVGATRSALSTQAAATNDARQATVDALNTEVAATASADNATSTAIQQELFAHATATQIAAETQSAVDALATGEMQTATQVAAETQSAANALATGEMQTATQDAAATQSAIEQQQTSEAETATQAAQMDATSTRAAELQAINETLQAVQQAQTEAANVPTQDTTQTLLTINQTATADRVVGTMQALDNRATALRLTATSRAIATPVATSTTVPEQSPTPTQFVPTELPTRTPTRFAPTQPPSTDIGEPGVFSPGDIPDARVLTTADDGFIRASYVDIAEQDLYVETVFEIPDSPGYWDFGIALREQGGDVNQELRFFIDGRYWIYNIGTELAGNGELPSALLNLDVGAPNRLTLVAFGGTGVALVNGVIVAVLDFSSITDSGTVFIGSGFAPGSVPDVDIRVRTINAARLDVAYGPESGQIVHNSENNQAETLPAEGITPNSAIVRGVFDVPYPSSRGSWDIGFDIRNQNGSAFDRIILDPFRENWYLYYFDGEYRLLTSGSVTNLRTGQSDTNEVIVIAIRERGYLIINGQAVGEFALSDDGTGGSVDIGTGFFAGNELTGTSTGFEDFTVWTLSDQP